MQALPTSEEQAWLLSNLGEIVQQRGYAPFVLAPIVEPTAEFFPECRGSAAYLLDRSTRRLLQYAGLHELEPVLGVFSDDDLPASMVPKEPSCTVAGCFIGIEDRRCYFGLNSGQDADAEHLAGIMSHEVAHAYRARHGLVRDQKDEEELLTDLTSAYLGFGILASNNSLRYRQAGGVAWTEWKTDRTGYLPPQAFSFMLAVQAVVRGLERAAWRRLAKLLEANQASFFAAAIAALEPEAEGLKRALGIPEPDTWPPAPAPETIATPLPAFVPWVEEMPGRVNAGRPVFRVRESKANPVAFLALTLMAVPAAVVGERNLTAALLLFVAAGAAGLLLGSRRERDTCSDAECRTILAPDAVECPECGGTISGRIRRRSERFDAEERLVAEATQRPRAVRQDLGHSSDSGASTS
jgi:hypothetical protein